MMIQFYAIVRIEQNEAGEIVNINTVGFNDDMQRAKKASIAIAKTDAEDHGMHFERFGFTTALYKEKGDSLPCFTYNVVFMKPKMEINN